MSLKINPLRWIATAYAVVVGLLSIWAWYIDITMLHSNHEHLAPDIFLAMATLPSSQGLDWLYDKWPDTFSGFAQLGYLTVCAMFQAGAFFMLAWLVDWSRRE
jgi:p-aminobenzoyl-glutamate transporter AbgT